jgi:hypothetical protein
VGGSIVDFEDIGRDAGTVASRLIRGATPPPTPVPSYATSVPRFDGRQLARWHLDQRRLPENSQIIFHETTYWEKYGWYVVSAVGLIGRRRRSSSRCSFSANAAARPRRRYGRPRRPGGDTWVRLLILTASPA